MNGNLSCIIIDDEPNAHLVLKHYFKQLKELSFLGSFYNGIDAIDFMRINHVDLVFLDINMPELSGFEMLHALSQPPLVIFTTAHSEFALDGYKYSAVDYLLKPIELPRFLSAIDKAIQRKRLDVTNSKSSRHNELPMDSFIKIKKDGELIKVELETIVYVQSYGNYVKIISDDKKYLTSITTFEIEKKLPKDKFLRIHKSYIISIKHVSKLEHNRLFIKNLELPIGNTFKREVLLKLSNIINNHE